MFYKKITKIMKNEQSYKDYYKFVNLMRHKCLRIQAFVAGIKPTLSETDRQFKEYFDKRIGGEKKWLEYSKTWTLCHNQLRKKIADGIAKEELMKPHYYVPTQKPLII